MISEGNLAIVTKRRKTFNENRPETSSFFYMYENLKYSFKNKGVLEASEDLAKLMEQVKEVRLQKN